MQGKCNVPNGSANLKFGGVYYLFPHGGSAYEVSRFPRLGSHFGVYQKSRFEIITTKGSSTEPKKPDKPLLLEVGKIYEAELIWRKTGYSTPLGKYFITSNKGCYENDQDCYFYSDVELRNAKGRFPLHWFTDIREYNSEAIKEVVKELPREQWQQVDLFSF
ncbi:hypothetical protein [Lysinibacillus sphaericus]|uniref:hypothetical protein n=1 Tax=Lysinibacillus sphaericus TaxID=1421 RepID=UPI0018CD3814|nr:hypothetical protein [Lysinibacillus sphaericus]